MPNFYDSKKSDDVLASHGQAVTQLFGGFKTAGDAGLRAVQLWTQAAALNDAGELSAAQTSFRTDAASQWNGGAKTNLVKAIDALASMTGLTRAQILADVADEAATQF